MYTANGINYGHIGTIRRVMVFAAFAFAAAASIAQERREAVAPANVFAGRECVVVRKIAGAAEGEMLSFRISRHHRTLQKGVVTVGEGGVAEIPVSVPAMHDGLAMRLEMTLSRSVDAVGGQPGPETIYAFSDQPFADGTLPVRAADVNVFDPDGRTAAALEAIKVPFQRVRDFAELSGTTNSFVVVHEGVSPGGDGNLGGIIDALIDDGNRVIVLAPADGCISIHAAKDALKYGFAKEVLAFKRSGRGMEYELDFSVMGGNRFTVATDGGISVADFGGDGEVEAAAWEAANGRGRGVICGLGLISDWEKTPAARWLLADFFRSE